MKKIILPSLLALMFLSGSLHLKAQQNVIKVNPLSAFLLTANVAYERALSPSTSVQLGIYYGGLSFNNQEIINGSESARLRWLGITPEFRYYVTHNRREAPGGFYVGPYLRFQNWTVNGEYREMDQFGDPYISNVKVGLLQMGGGGKIGYQFLIGDVVSLDLYTGIGYNNVRARVIENNSTTPDTELDYVGPGGSSVGFPTGFAVGIAF